MTDARPQDLERVAAQVAVLASELIRDSVGKATVTATKSSLTDVVTETDLASEMLIRQELERHWPGSAVLGEEMGETDGATGVGWIVDPIDGTVNFTYDLPVVSVSIAATVDGVIVAGAVADVLRREVFSASAGRGARRDGAPISTGSVDDLAAALVLTGFAYDSGIRADQAQVLTEILPACRDIRCMGSAALNLCWVACGRGDAYFERDLKIYDYAAGAIIAGEAGASVRVPGPQPGSRLGPEQAGDLVLASTPGIHRPLEALLLSPRIGQPEPTERSLQA